MTWWRETYDPISFSTEKRGSCPVCGKRVRRSHTFTQTLNPFNKNDDGDLKNVREIMAELKEEAAAWEPDFTHEKCMEDFNDAA